MIIQYPDLAAKPFRTSAGSIDVGTVFSGTFKGNTGYFLRVRGHVIVIGGADRFSVYPVALHDDVLDYRSFPGSELIIKEELP